MADFSWTILGDLGTLPGGGEFVTGSPTLPCPITAFTPQDILDLFDRILPEHYLATLKSPGPGYELLQAYAKIFARISTAVDRLACLAFISSSTSGAFSTGTVQLFRNSPHPEGISVIVKTGTVVSASRSGRQFKTTADVTFGPSDVGPFNVPIMAEAQGYEYDVPGQVVAADGTVLPGEIDTIVTLVEVPDVGDITIKVRQITPTVGGIDAALDQHGLDRDILRLVGETDNAYKRRVRSIPDNISPDAFNRTLQQLFDPVNAGYDLIETWNITYQTCWDAPSDFIGGSNFDPNLFVYDDPDADHIPFRNRWLDENDHRGGLIALVDNIQPILDTGMIWDDTALNSASLVSPNTGGKRAICAYDVPPDLGFEYLHGAWDGFDAPKQALYKGIYDTMQRIKAAGISAVVELKGQ